MTDPTAPPADPSVPAYRPLNARRRLVIGAMAVATAVGVVVVLLHPPGGVQRVRRVESPASATAGAATLPREVVAPVMVVPPTSAAASTPR